MKENMESGIKILDLYLAPGCILMTEVLRERMKDYDHSRPRTKSGIRNYDEASCGWVELMKCMRKAGVQIEALIEYVDLFQQGDATLEARKNILVDQRDQLVARMEEMQESLDRLNQKIENYDRDMRKAEEHLRNLEEKRQEA